jgi:hypothetical protein
MNNETIFIVSDCKLIPTNLDQNKIKPNLSIFPNPSQGIIKVDIDDFNCCEVYNMMGVHLLTTKNKTIDLRNLIKSDQMTSSHQITSGIPPHLIHFQVQTFNS